MISKNEQKFIRSLKVKKYRTREECFLVEGSKNVLELLNSDFRIQLLIGTEDFFASNIIENNVRKEIVSINLLEQMSTFKTNNACLAVVQFKRAEEVENINDSNQFALDGVGDPGNLGTIIRTLDWFGYRDLICSKDCAEFYHPKVIASTMGSFTRINVKYVDMSQYLSSIKVPVFAADMRGGSIHKTSIPNPSVILMGSESNGISNECKKYVTDYISIPRVGEAESLNVGVATGIIASHLRL